MTVLHVIPVPQGMTPEEAWAEIDTFGQLIEYDPSDQRFTNCQWAAIEADH